MINKQEAVKAYRTLKQYYTDQQPDCSSCIFAYLYDDCNGVCEFVLYTHPVEWTCVGGCEDG